MAAAPILSRTALRYPNAPLALTPSRGKKGFTFFIS